MNIAKAFPLSTLAILGALTMTSMAPARAADEVNFGAGITAAGAPLALRGYDPVAYFTDDKPTQGVAKFTGTHNGVAYYFSSPQNLDAFKANPAKYEPQYGGFCAYGAALGKKFDGDPRLWKIVNGKLYVNLNEEIVAAFEKDVPGAIAKADRNWTVIVHKAVKDL